MTTLSRRIESRDGIIYACFFLSGATALMYEIIWTRFLNLTFGCTTYSITTVLTAFMAGLALGSLVFGRLVDNWERPLFFYGVIEILIGVFALFTEIIFSGVGDAYLAIVSRIGVEGTAVIMIKFFLSFCVMLVPTTLMGASLPVLSKYFISRKQELSKKLGFLYAVNTFGAVLGTFLVGFVFLHTLGLKSTILFAAVMNLGIGVLVIAKDKELRKSRALECSPVQESADVSEKKEPALPSAANRPFVIYYAVLAFMISGAIAMVYEIAWTRVLTLIIGSSTYAFSIILICFLLGIATGSYVISKYIPKDRIGLKLFIAIQLLIGFAGYLLIPLFSFLPDIMLFIFRVSPGSYKAITAYQFFLVFCIVILPTMLMGATLPVIGQIVSAEIKMIGRKIGDIYFFNTFGAIFGSFMAGFILIPHLGTLATLKLSIFTNILIACSGAIIYQMTRPKNAYYSVTTFTFMPLLLLLVFHSGWDEELMDTGVSIYGHLYSKDEHGIRDRKRGSELLYLKEGLNATVSVRRDADITFLRTNGKTDASTGRDMTTQLFSGYLPLFAHPNPEKALVIGFGSGVTSGAIGQFDFIKKLDIAEIEASVIEAGRYFSEVNHDVVNMPNVRIHYRDGRNFLLETDEQYDIITSEPSNPWISGVASLFTTDFYQIVNDRLKPGGVFCQWFQTYNTSYFNIRMVLATLRQNFKHVQVWYANQPDLLIVCSNEEIVFDHNRVESLIHSSEQVEREFRTHMGVRSANEFYGRYLFGGPTLKKITADYVIESIINTDDKPYLEFLAPKTLYTNRSVEIFRALYREITLFPPTSRGDFTEADFAENLCFRANDLLRYGMIAEAQRLTRSALAYGDSSQAQILLGKISVAKNQILKAKESFEKAMRLDPTGDGYLYLSELFAEQGLFDRAMAVMQSTDPTRLKNKRYERIYAQMLDRAGKHKEAIPWYQKAFEKGQIEQDAYDKALGLAYYRLGLLPKAKQHMESSYRRNPLNFELAQALAKVYLGEKEFDKAITVYGAINKFHELNPSMYQNLIRSCQQAGRDDLVMKYLREYRKKHPAHATQKGDGAA